MSMSVGYIVLIIISSFSICMCCCCFPTRHIARLRMPYYHTMREMVIIPCLARPTNVYIVVDPNEQIALAKPINKAKASVLFHP